MLRDRFALLCTAAVLGLSSPGIAHAAPEDQAAASDEDAVLQQGTVVAKVAIEAHKRGEFEIAAEAGMRALELLAPAFGWGSEPIGVVAGVTVDSLVKLGRNDEADAIIAKVKQARGTPEPTTPGPSSAPTVQESDTAEMKAAKLANQAFVAVTEGRYDDAIGLGLQAVELLEKAEPDGAVLLSYRTMVADLYSARLQFAEAEQLLAANLAAAERNNDDEQRHQAYLALGRLRLARGEVDEAEKEYRKGLAVAERLGTAHARAAALEGLGDVELWRDRPGKAVPMLEEAVELQERRAEVGAGHLFSPVMRLGEAYELAGRFEDAEPMLQRALGIADRQYGQGSPAGWRVRVQLGRLYRSMGRHPEAIAILEEVLQEQESKLDPLSPSIAATMNHLAETLWAKGGEPTRTIALATRAAEIQEQLTSSAVTSGTEGQKRAYLERYASGTDRIISYAVREVPGDEAAARLAVNTILRRKGRVLDAVSGQLQAARGRLDEATGNQLDRLGQVQAQVSALVLRGPAEGQSGDDHAAELASLRTEAKRLEEALSPVEELRLSTEQIELTKVQAALPSDARLIEIALFRAFDPDYRSFATAFGDPHYVAYVIASEGTPTIVDLGAAAPIDEAVEALRRALANPKTDVSSLARHLDGLTMEKIRPHLGKVERVFVSPDGQLNLVPFAAMIDERGRYLIERYEFTYLSSGRDLMRLKDAPPPADSGPVILGSPDFSASGGTGAASNGGVRSADMSAEMFSPLPGTQEEATAISKLLDTEPLLGAQATESALKKVSAPLLLHVATHGFFLVDQAAGRDGTRGVTYQKKASGQWVPPPEEENPLIRSGLALTGANLRAAPDGEDGILTALEVAHMDLTGTRLVVLSACETGVGKVQNGEGVYGLRRALVIAGSRSQLMSLWQVDDEATRDLMVRYYKNLRRQQGRSEALRRSQRQLARRKQTAHPFYWAAFIPSGDWRPMEVEVKTSREPRMADSSRRGGSGKWASYVKRKFTSPMWFVYGGYSQPLVSQRFEDQAIGNSASFDLRMRAFVRPFLAFGFDYGRHPWSSPDSASQLEVAINRFEFVTELDALPLPNDWRVRPGLHPYLGAGLAWGRERMISDPLVGAERDQNLMGGAGITFGSDAAIYVRITDRLVLQLRGGIAKPIYRMRADGERRDYDDEFARAWRWQVGLGIGGLPK